MHKKLNDQQSDQQIEYPNVILHAKRVLSKLMVAS